MLKLWVTSKLNSILNVKEQLVSKNTFDLLLLSCKWLKLFHRTANIYLNSAPPDNMQLHDKFIYKVYYHFFYSSLFHAFLIQLFETLRLWEEHIANLVQIWCYNMEPTPSNCHIAINLLYNFCKKLRRCKYSTINSPHLKFLITLR